MTTRSCTHFATGCPGSSAPPSSSLCLLPQSALHSKRLRSFMPLIACMLALVGPGYTPYITNLLQGKHILYPVMGEGRVDIMARMTPIALEGHSAIAKLAFSLAAETA